MVASGSVDIGIIADTHAQPSGLREPLFREELYLVGPQSAPLFTNSDIALSAVAHLPLILNAMPGGLRTVIDAGFEELCLKPQVEIEIDANNALLELLVEGAGYSILPYSLVASVRGATLLGAARITNPSLTRILYGITAPNKPVRSVVREVLRRIRTISVQKSARAHWLPVDQV